ncbi:MAG: methyltransferase domain-containing protein [Minisyncoccia bacterium]
MDIIKRWFERKPPKTKDKNILSEAYNTKYGNYDYTQDSRSVDKTFLDIFTNSISADDFENVVICGANSGYEVDILQKIKPSVKITAVDISNVSLQKLHTHFPDVNFLHEDLENLKGIKSKAFDLYISLRAVHSSNIDVDKAIKEAVRITKNKIVISVSNGYVIDGQLVKGMYDYDTETINSEKPLVVRDKISKLLNELDWETISQESDAEIFIVAKPNK